MDTTYSKGKCEIWAVYGVCFIMCFIMRICYADSLNWGCAGYDWLFQVNTKVMKVHRFWYIVLCVSYYYGGL